MGLVKGKVNENTTLPVGKAKPGEATCEELAALLESADATERRHAARDILHCRDAANALVSRLKREDKAAVREAILTTLIRLDDPSATAGLADCLRSEDAALRNEAIEALRELAASEDKANAVPPVLLSLLADPDPDVRIFAVNIIESARHPDVERWLIEVIERDAHVNVCATAVDLLCEVGTEAAIDPLLHLKARFVHDAYIQFAADLALKRIRES
jgi:HEAT repeat protein